MYLAVDGLIAYPWPADGQSSQVNRPARQQLQPIFFWSFIRTRLGASTLLPPFPTRLTYLHLHTQDRFLSHCPRSSANPTLLGLCFFSAVHDWRPPHFARRLLSLATMASTPDAVYFPALGQCLNGDKVLLSACP